MGASGDKHAVRCNEGVDSQDVQTGLAIDQYAVIEGTDCVNILAQYIFPAVFVDEQVFVPRKLDGSGHEVYALCMAYNALGGVEGLLSYGLVDNVGNGVRELVRALTAQRHGEVCLRVEVDAQHLFILPDKGGGEVYCGGGLGDAALLVDDRDYL